MSYSITQNIWKLDMTEWLSWKIWQPFCYSSTKLQVKLKVWMANLMHKKIINSGTELRIWAPSISMVLRITMYTIMTNNSYMYVCMCIHIADIYICYSKLPEPASIYNFYKHPLLHWNTLLISMKHFVK